MLLYNKVDENLAKVHSTNTEVQAGVQELSQQPPCVDFNRLNELLDIIAQENSNQVSCSSNLIIYFYMLS